MSDRIEPREGIVMRTLPDERKALADAEQGIMLIVNPMGAAIWALLEEKPTFDGLVGELQALFAAPEKRIADDVRSFLDQLRGHGFLV